MDYTYEMNPCQLSAGEGHTAYEACDETDPDIHCWSVYRRPDEEGGLAEWVADFDTQEEALTTLTELRENQANPQA